MALVLPVFNNSCNCMHPLQILDQRFEDLFSPIHTAMRSPTICRQSRCSPASKSDSSSTVTADKDKFQVNLDVHQFKPDEITVKVTGKNAITVEGKHEEQQDDHGFISRHFIRRYVLPDNHDVNNIVSSLSSDGVLSITAPRFAIAGEEQRSIPIQQTGVPAKPIENKKENICTKKD